jgi:hypothetical protein
VVTHIAKRRRDELTAELALLEEESSKGERDSNHEHCNKRAKEMQTTDPLVVCKAKQIEKTKQSKHQKHKCDKGLKQSQLSFWFLV